MLTVALAAQNVKHNADHNDDANDDIAVSNRYMREGQTGLQDRPHGGTRNDADQQADTPRRSIAHRSCVQHESLSDAPVLRTTSVFASEYCIMRVTILSAAVVDFLLARLPLQTT